MNILLLRNFLVEGKWRENSMNEIINWLLEDDTPENLMNTNSLYKEMYEVQKKWYE